MAWIPTIQIGATSGPDAVAVRTPTGQKSPQGFLPAADAARRAWSDRQSGNLEGGGKNYAP